MHRFGLSPIATWSLFCVARAGVPRLSPGWKSPGDQLRPDDQAFNRDCCAAHEYTTRRACVIQSAVALLDSDIRVSTTAANSWNIRYNVHIISHTVTAIFFHPAECHHEMIVRCSKVLLSL